MTFEEVTQGISQLLTLWEPKLMALPDHVVCGRKNVQQRTIKQILGHMVDSASNNIHRIVHLQYQQSPFLFPNYASNGNNDRWIAIQDYQNEDWQILVQLWKYLHLHYIHVVKNVDQSKLTNAWYANETDLVSLEDMILDFLRHFKLHINEITELLNQSSEHFKNE